MKGTKLIVILIYSTLLAVTAVGMVVGGVAVLRQTNDDYFCVTVIFL